MLNYGTKIDNDETSAGVVVAKEYNSIMNEQKNTVSPFLSLNELDNQQTAKAIDIASKAMFYTDTGTVNNVVLSRGATSETIETLFDGMVVMFTPANINTGATTLKIKTLDAKPLYYNGAILGNGFLNISSKYIAIYDVANDRFNVDLIVGYEKYIEAKNEFSLLDGNFIGNVDTIKTAGHYGINQGATNLPITGRYFSLIVFGSEAMKTQIFTERMTGETFIRIWNGTSWSDYTASGGLTSMQKTVQTGIKANNVTYTNGDKWRYIEVSYPSSSSAQTITFYIDGKRSMYHYEPPNIARMYSIWLKPNCTYKINDNYTPTLWEEWE